MTSYRGWILLCLSVLVGCGGASAPEPEPVAEDTTGAEEAPPPPPPEPAHVRLIHAAFDPAAAAVGAAFDGADPVITELAYQHASGYVDLPAGEHTLSLLGADGTELLGWTPPAFAEGGLYTLVVASADEMPVLFGAAEDQPTPSAENTSGIRVFHGIVGLDAIDVCLAGESARADGILIFANVAPTSFAGEDGARYAELPLIPGAPATEMALQFRTTNARPCHGRVQGVARVTPIAGSRYTLVAVGRTSGRARVDRELLVCADPPATDTSCTTVPITAR